MVPAFPMACAMGHDLSPLRGSKADLLACTLSMDLYVAHQEQVRLRRTTRMVGG
jgi:hypothetical protein